jgi:hypothetical protein
MVNERYRQKIYFTFCNKYDNVQLFANLETCANFECECKKPENVYNNTSDTTTIYTIVYSMVSAEWKKTCPPPVVILILFVLQANPSQEEQLDALGTLPGLGQAGSMVRMKHSVCHLVGIGTPPPPLLPASVSPPPPRTKGGVGRHTRLRLRESQFRRLEKKLSTPRRRIWGTTFSEISTGQLVIRSAQRVLDDL